MKNWIQWFKSHWWPATKHDLKKLKDEIMSKVDEALAAFDEAMTTYNEKNDAAIEGLTGDVADMKAQILALQNDQTATWTPENQAVLDKLTARAQAATAKLEALDALTPPAVPTPPTPPEPEP